MTTFLHLASFFQMFFVHHFSNNLNLKTTRHLHYSNVSSHNSHFFLCGLRFLIIHLCGSCYVIYTKQTFNTYKPNKINCTFVVPPAVGVTQPAYKRRLPITTIAYYLSYCHTGHNLDISTDFLIWSQGGKKKMWGRWEDRSIQLGRERVTKMGGVKHEREKAGW